MKKAVLISFLAVNGFCSQAGAGNMGANNLASTWQWLGAVSAGPIWENAGAQQTFYLTPAIENTYAPNKSTQTLADIEVFLGAQHSVGTYLMGQFGIAVNATNKASLNGMVWSDADPAFSNYTYRYDIQHTHIAAKTKLLADMGYWVTPWINASIGVGFNRASNFQNTPVIFEAVETPNFTSYTKTAFTYTAGAGLQKILNQHWQVGAGYEFADWGKSQLGRAFGQTKNTGLQLSHLYTNGILFNLTYVA